MTPVPAPHGPSRPAAPAPPDRAGFMERLEALACEAGRTGRRLGAAVLSLRDFRALNTTYGYATGDAVLSAVARRVNGVLRPTDHLYRIGDKEFALLLPGLASPEHAVLAANRITGVLREPLDVGERSIKVKTTVGMAVLPDHAGDAEGLFRCADLALSHARAHHEPYRLYASDADHDTRLNLAMERALEAAVADRALRLFLQPKVTLPTGGVTGVEALARWNDAEWGDVPPERFIAVAESSGLIVPLTLWSLDSALCHWADFRDRGLDLTMAVNLSPALLDDPHLEELVGRSMAIWGVTPGRLVLEVTENAIMADPDHSLDNLRRLRGLGAVISIDDFGTGYSSLAYLKRLPVGELKIDKSFVMHMDTDAGDATIVRSVIELGHSFGLRVVAEGVEDAATLARLGALGCDQAQGFHLSRPMPAPDIPAWIARHGAR